MTRNKSDYWRAKCVVSFVVPVMGALGVVIFAWVLPIVVVLVGHGDHSLLDFNVEWWIFPGAPKWLDQSKDHRLISVIGLGSMAIALVGVAVFGRAGERLSAYLIVKKWQWLTKEELDNMYKVQWL